MSESGTMFNERDRRCAVVQLMLSTDPSYDSQNHRWMATNNREVPRVMKTKFPATVTVFGVVSSEGHIMPLLYCHVQHLNDTIIKTQEDFFNKIFTSHFIARVRKGLLKVCV